MVGVGNLLQYSCLENPTEEPGGLQFVGSDMMERAHARTHFKWFSNVYIASKTLTFLRVKGDILLGLVDDSNLVLLVQTLHI